MCRMTIWCSMPCDRQLMVMLLTQYIDNACKYSIFGTGDHNSRRGKRTQEMVFLGA
jgi:hypothetical protein